MFNNKLFTIAEIGGNHGGSLDRAKRIIDLAAETPVDAIKFQSYTPDGLVNPILDPDRYKHFGKFSLGLDDFYTLSEYVEQTGKLFMTSIWNEEWTEELGKLQKVLKVGSGDLTNYPLLSKFCDLKKPMVISTAMSTLEEIREAVAFIQKQDEIYKDENYLSIMQCVAMYGNPKSEFSNLRTIETLKYAFPNSAIGYSDHTIGFEAIIYAYLMGIKTLEFHFTDDKKDESFRDHEISLDQEDVIKLYESIEKIDISLGSGEKVAVSQIESEDRIKEFRRGVYLNKSVGKGHTLSAEDLITLRPNAGISAIHFYNLIGMKAKCDITQFEKLEWSMLERQSFQ